MRIVAFVLALCLWPLDLFAQTRGGTREAGERRSDRDEEERLRRRRAAARPEWSFDLLLTPFYDTNVHFSSSEVSSVGTEAAAIARYQNRASWPTWTAEYGIARHWYEATDRWNRTSHNLRGSYIQRSRDRKLRFETVGQIQINGWTVDRELSDIYSLSPRFDWLPDNRNRVRALAAFRWKELDDDARDDALFDENHDARNVYGGLEYRRSFASTVASSDHYFDLAARFETNDGRIARDSYRRTTWSATYVAPFGERDRIEMNLDYRDRHWTQRRVAGGSLRHDRRWTPSASWIHELTDRLRLEADYSYNRQFSNEPTRDFDAHRVGLTTRYRW